jgi:hypothetical protein
LRFKMMLLWSATALATTWFVAADGTGDFTSVTDAIDAASTNDAIIVAPGTYQEGSRYNSTYGGGFLIYKAITIIGAGPDEVFIEVTFDNIQGRQAAVTLVPSSHGLLIEGMTFIHEDPGTVSATSNRGYVAVNAIAAASGSATFRNVVFSMPTETNRAIVETGSGRIDLTFDQVTVDFHAGFPADIGIINTLGGKSVFTNSIIYNCSGETNRSSNPEFMVRHTNIYGYADAESYGNGNINADPLFSDPDANDWTLQSGSPAIDAGMEGTLDLDGTAADMGAFGGDVESYPLDADGDGYYTGLGLGGDPDCDDANPDISPGETEVCDGIDNNCDDEVDESTAADASTWYYDGDGDGYGLLEEALVACEAPADYADQAGDCDDGNPATAPGGSEYCNDIDDNCNNVIDDEASDARTWYADLDGDKYGDDESTVIACDQPNGYVNVGTDCDDSNPDLWLNVPDLPASCEQASTKQPTEEGCSSVPTPQRALWWLSFSAMLLVLRRRH